ncbi:hypothetical protein Tco_1117119 [Tanacetum coccineum]
MSQTSIRDALASAPRIMVEVKGGRRIVNMHEEDEPTTSKKPRTKVVEEERQMRETEEMGGDARKSLEKRILFQREKDIMALKDLKSLKARHEQVTQGELLELLNRSAQAQAQLHRLLEDISVR